MNFSFYISGTPSGRYSQYPDDYTASTIAELQQGVNGARLVIYREMDLVHYTYIEKLGDGCMIGFCLIFNKVMIHKPHQLIKLFRKVVEKRMVASGELIRYKENGELVFMVKSMNECAKVYEDLKEFIDSEFENNASKYDIRPITTIYNGVKSTGELDSSATDNQILVMTNQHNKVFINDGKGIEHGYIPQIIASLREHNQKAKDEIELLQNENKKLNRKKKQYKYVIILILIVLGCGAGLFVLNKNLNKTKYRLESANSEINRKENTITKLKSQIEDKKTELEEAEERYSDLESEVISVAPFVITSVEIGNAYDDGSMETDFGGNLYQDYIENLIAKVYYKGFTSGSYSLKTKWYRPNGTLMTNDESPYDGSQSRYYDFSKGTNSLKLDSWEEVSTSGWRYGTYRLEIWYDDKCVFVKKFTIYS